ncbi:3-methyl-2-oxobutanoate hydroxymethyltransferase [bacterium CPR1]|nr:3-methyl-2-oxobutanoate hydroxymethyltransferase [bacterium CPR1]
MRRVTAPALARLKKDKRKIVMVTAYDSTMARLVDAAEVDVILVGDSLGMVMLGMQTTVPVTLDHMVLHTASVTRGGRRALVVADLPFMTYQQSVSAALESAGRLLKEGGAQAVKLEGGETVLPQVQALVQAGVPVMGHLGLTPQSIHAFGGYRVQGRGQNAASKLMEDALALEQAGAFALVLECIPSNLAARVTRKLAIPTIGIGAGPKCDGQVLVLHDMLGMFSELQPVFVKRYAEVGQAITEAVSRYGEEVRAGEFPGPEHGYGDKP